MRFPYRSKFNFAMWIATLLVSVLIGFGIVLLLERPTFGDGAAMYVAASASPTAAGVQSMALVTSLPQQLTPIGASARAASTPEQQASQPASSSHPLGPIAAPTQVANTIPEQQASPVGSSPQPLPTTAPIPTTAPSVVAVVPTTAP